MRHSLTSRFRRLKKDTSPSMTHVEIDPYKIAGDSFDISVFGGAKRHPCRDCGSVAEYRTRYASAMTGASQIIRLHSTFGIPTIMSHPIISESAIAEDVVAKAFRIAAETEDRRVGNQVETYHSSAEQALSMAHELVGLCDVSGYEQSCPSVPVQIKIIN